MYKSSPLSEGDGGSLSSRSSAEDMVPEDGVLGSLLLKSPGKWQKWIITFSTLHVYVYVINTKSYTDGALLFKSLGMVLFLTIFTYAHQ